MFWVISIPEFIAVGFCLFRDTKLRLGVFTQGCSSTLFEVNSPMGFTTPKTDKSRDTKESLPGFLTSLEWAFRKQIFGHRRA